MPIKKIKTIPSFSQGKLIKYIEIAKNLLSWNSKHLVKDADLKKSDLEEYFAAAFQVRANGRSYNADHDNYLEFLNQLRETIATITYDVHEWIADKQNVVIPMKAHIIRVDCSKEHFDAMLLLKFDQRGKIVLWHEVYVKL